MSLRPLLVTALALILLPVGACDVYDLGPVGDMAPAIPGGSMALSRAEIARGLKAALNKGVHQATSTLGRTNGFWGNVDVRILMPPELQDAEQTLRRFGQERIADSFIRTMNRAAEAAAPETVDILTRSVSRMTLTDVRDILHGPDNAATMFFKRTASRDLARAIRPIVSRTTEQTGATAYFKRFESTIQMAAPLTPHPELADFELDGYVTDKALEGLFTMIASEEKQIRRDPAARTTQILRRVFGSVN
jgi:hypothetical protein